MLAKYVWVSSGHFTDDTLDHVGEIKSAIFFGNTRMKDNMKKQVTEFLFQVLFVPAFDSIEDFIGFFECVFGNRFAGLTNIPGAAGCGGRAGPS